MHLLYRFLLYGFPIVLLIFETLIRFALSDNFGASTFYLSLCSAATSLLVPVIVPKNVAQKYNIQVPNGATLRCSRDEYLVTIGWIMVLITLCVWTYALVIPPSEAALVEYIFGKGKTLHIPNATDSEFIACALTYFIAVVLTEIKELV